MFSKKTKQVKFVRDNCDLDIANMLLKIVQIDFSHVPTKICLYHLEMFPI